MKTVEQLSNNDIAPKLYEQLEKRLKGLIANDPQIRAIKKKLKNKNVSQSDAWLYAECVARHTSNALNHVLTPSNLPGGVLYWNIAEHTVKPILELAYRTIATMTASIQEMVWVEQGIGLKPKVADVPEERINSFLNKLVLSGGSDDEE